MLSACAVLAAPAAAAPAPRRPEVVVHEATELAWLLAGLSPLGRGDATLNRQTDYWRAAEVWFAPFADHPAVTALGADFNLPRLIGNAANHGFDLNSRLIRAKSGVAMWGDRRGDLFTRNRSAIEQFARESRARVFLKEQAGALEAGRAALREAVDLADMQAWLDAQFMARPAAMQVYVSPVTGGWNFTNLDPVTPRLWVPAPSPSTSEDAKLAIARGIFTEMDHNYVNPATKRLRARAYGFMTVEKGWATERGWEDYGSPELVVNEYMTFAAFVAYAQGRLNEDSLARLEVAVDGLMVRKGFPKFAAFWRELKLQRASAAAPLEALYPAVLARAATDFAGPSR